ncbi:MAG: hypothetical protein AB7O96_09700, partial [Pseudobdellovibrionaceae bacterium]
KMIQDLIPAVNLSPSEHKISFEMTKGFWGDYQSLTIVIDNLKYMTFSSQATKEGSLMTFFNNKDGRRIKANSGFETLLNLLNEMALKALSSKKLLTFEPTRLTTQESLFNCAIDSRSITNFIQLTEPPVMEEPPVEEPPVEEPPTEEPPVEEPNPIEPTPALPPTRSAPLRDGESPQGMEYSREGVR